MPNGDGSERRSIDGRSIEEALDVVEGAGGPDRATARAALNHVAEDGVVSSEAAEATLRETSLMVSTPENRAEFAAIALEEAREAAAPVADVDVVAARLETFESRLAAIDSEIEALGERLQSLAQRDVENGDLLSIGREIQAVRDEADRLQHAADELQADVEAFEEWLADGSIRAEDLHDDVEAVADSFDDREAVLDAIAAEGGEDGAGALPAEDPGAVWAEATVGHRVTALLLADVRAELDDLQTMAEREGGAPDDGAAAPSLATIDAQVADLEDRRVAIAERLDEVAKPAWRERFAERLTAVDDVLADVEPPIAWGDVQAAIAEAGR